MSSLLLSNYVVFKTFLFSVVAMIKITAVIGVRKVYFTACMKVTRYKNTPLLVSAWHASTHLMCFLGPIVILQVNIMVND